MFYTEITSFCKNPGHQVSDGLPCAEALHTYCCIFIGGGRVCFVWPLLGGRPHKEPTRDSSRLHLCLFLLWWACISILHCVINVSHEYNYMLSPVHPIKTLNVGEITEIHSHSFVNLYKGKGYPSAVLLQDLFPSDTGLLVNHHLNNVHCFH